MMSDLVLFLAGWALATLRMLLAWAVRHPNYFFEWLLWWSHGDPL
ncbi:MAG: DUF1295 domain-containing protein [Candidatus Competibacter sp.]|nr:DUF1295 domain-containing protein [Candidatus Competibacter sp.]MDG4583285.1 DUF1295 domain-containing protein [Candidatus Competibacter sp.]